MHLQEKIDFFRFPFYILYGCDPTYILSTLEDALAFQLNRYYRSQSSSRVITPQSFRSGHPDLLILRPSGVGGNYTKEDIAPLFSFLTLAPQDWPQRFVLIEQADGLGSLLQKMLKILEDPVPGKKHSRISIFFLCLDIHHFPGTILGRAQQIPCNPPPSISSSLEDDPYTKLLSQVMDQVLTGGNYKQVEQFIQLLKYLDKSKIYNIPNKERHSLLSSYLHANIKN